MPKKMMNTKPTRLAFAITKLGKSVYSDEPQKRNVHAKVRDKKMYKPTKFKTLKGDLGKNGYPGGQKNKNSIQKSGIEAFDCIS